MPTVIYMLVEVSVPVPDKDAIGQMVVTQALTAAADAIKQVATERDGRCIIEATIRKVKAAEPPVAVGDTPETMPVSLPG